MVQIEPENLKRHYDRLSDDALQEIDRGDLMEAARMCYDAEMKRRGLERWAPSEESQSPTNADLRLVGTFLSPDEANLARGLLQSADIPCSLENEHSAAWTGTGGLRLMVPEPDYDRACEVLESTITDEDLIAQAESVATNESAADKGT